MTPEQMTSKLIALGYEPDLTGVIEFDGDLLEVERLDDPYDDLFIYNLSNHDKCYEVPTAELRNWACRRMNNEELYEMDYDEDGGYLHYSSKIELQLMNEDREEYALELLKKGNYKIIEP